MGSRDRMGLIMKPTPQIAPRKPAAQGVPLGRWRAHADVGVLVICRRCQDRRVLDLEAVIARLAARGLDGEAIGIRALAGHVRGACARCGARAWETRPHYPGIPGMNGFAAPPG